MRRLLILLFFIFLALLSQSKARAEDAPNIIVIQTDDQSFSSLRAKYRDGKSSRLVMPNTLREIFRGGTEFTQSYVTSPLCSPSRASLLTGQYPHNNGLRGNEGSSGGWSGWQALPLWEENIPLALQENGYRTSHFGKFTNSYWNKGRAENIVPPGWSRWFTTSFRSGDARYYGYRVNSDGSIRGPFGRADYQLEGPGVDRKRVCTVRSLSKPQSAQNCNYLTDVMTRKAVSEIHRGEQPLYLHIDYQAPHGDARAPAGPQPASRHLFSARQTPLLRPANFNEWDTSDKPSIISDGTQRLDQATRRIMRRSWRRTLESLRAVDDGVGAIFQALRKSKKLGNTYVFFTSDNGFFFGEHRFSSGKSLPYEAVARVPLAVRGPDVPRGQKITSPVSTMDIAVTSIALAGAQTSYPLDGRSLQGLWQGSKDIGNRGLLISLARSPDEESSTNMLSRSKPPQLTFWAARVGPYKYVRYSEGTEELYNLRDDPWELENLSADETWLPVLLYMREQLTRLQDCSGPQCLADLPPWPDENPPAPNLYPLYKTLNKALRDLRAAT